MRYMKIAYASVLVAAGCLVLAGLPGVGQAPKLPKHVDEAVKLVKGLKLDKTTYRPAGTVVKWKEGTKASETHTDACGFLTALLYHAYPAKAPEFFKKWLKPKPPQPEHYFQAIDKQKGFTKVTSIDDVQPGDIIAIKYPSDAQTMGHLMLVAAAVKSHAVSDPVIAGTEQWEVPVIDSSMAGHGKADTRRLADGVYHAGLGMGSLRLYTKSGNVSGYAWSLLGNSSFHDSKARPLVIGRALMTPDP